MAESPCPDCGGTGFKVLERDGISAAERCACGLKDAPSRAWQRARVPPNFQDDSFHNFSVGDPQANPKAFHDLSRVLTSVRGFARTFPSDDKPGLLLIGDPGGGKTHLAVAVLRILIENGHEGVFYDYQHLLDRIRASYSESSGDNDREAYQEAMEAEILLLDDLGAHRVTEWVQDIVTSIITYRCNHRKPLIATTNLPDADMTETALLRQPGESGPYATAYSLTDRIGMRARSRLFEMCRIVRMPKIADYRIQHAQR